MLETLHEVKLKAAVFEKANSFTAKQQMAHRGLSVEQCAFAGAPGNVFIPDSSEHQTYAKIDLKKDPPVAEETDAAHFTENQVVLAMFTVESYWMGAAPGFRGTLRELVHLMPFAHEDTLPGKVYTNSPPKRFKKA